MVYAQLDSNGYCVAITRSSEPLIGPQFVEIPELNPFYLGRRYVDGQWQ